MNAFGQPVADSLPPSLEWGAVIPVQLPNRGGLHNPPTGVPRLMAAILEDAMHVYIRERGSSRQSRAFHEARMWIHSNDRKWVFSFLRICEALNLDPFRMRRRLQAEQPVHAATNAA
jgi:hypothetical protein